MAALRAEVGGPGADEDDRGEEGHWRGTLRALQTPPKLFTSSKNRSFEFKSLGRDNTRESHEGAVGTVAKKSRHSPLRGHLVLLGTL